MWTRRRLSIESSFLSPCTSTIFPISLSALVKFLDTQVLPFPQLPNNTKDKWWQKCLVFPDRITQNVIWRRSCLWEILWKTCSSVLDVNYNRTEDKRTVRTVQNSNRGETNSCYNPAFFLQKQCFRSFLQETARDVRHKTFVLIDMEKNEIWY